MIIRVLAACLIISILASAFLFVKFYKRGLKIESYKQSLNLKETLVQEREGQIRKWEQWDGRERDAKVKSTKDIMDGFYKRNSEYVKDYNDLMGRAKQQNDRLNTLIHSFIYSKNPNDKVSLYSQILSVYSEYVDIKNDIINLSFRYKDFLHEKIHDLENLSKQ